MAKDYYLVHHGIKGQKWGIRRFQNEDGSYTPEGKERYRLVEGSRVSVERGDKKSSIYFKLDDEDELKMEVNDKDFREITEAAEREAIGILNALGALDLSYDELLQYSSMMSSEAIEGLNRYLDSYTDLAYSTFLEESLKRGIQK